MRDSVGRFDSGPLAAPVAGPEEIGASAQGEAFGALLALGYKAPEATRLLNGIDSANMSTEELIRAALKSAARA